jgi:hypothetical protein
MICTDDCESLTILQYSGAQGWRERAQQTSY